MELNGSCRRQKHRPGPGSELLSETVKQFLFGWTIDVCRRQVTAPNPVELLEQLFLPLGKQRLGGIDEKRQGSESADELGDSRHAHRLHVVRIHLGVADDPHFVD